MARHERVVILNRERAVLALVHPDDAGPGGTRRRGRPIREIVSALEGVPPPDPAFAADMEAVLRSVGPIPETPWER